MKAAPMNADRVDPAAPIVVIGAGQAGFSVCVKLREFGHSGPITLVGDEPQPPYQRPPLSKAYLLGEMARESLYFRPAAFFERISVDLRLATRAERIDRPSQEVVLSDGATLPYACLVLATGSRPRRLPAALCQDLAGIYYIRTLADIDDMAAEFRPARHVLVVGGGYIGLETAAVAAKLGLRVTVVEAAPRILQRVAAAETSESFRTLHRAHGVDLREGTGLVALAGVDRVKRALLTDGSEMAVDFVVAGIGVRPNVGLAEAAGLTIGNGIVVDAHCRTSDDRILAAGDCASFPWRGKRIRLESVGNAIGQAEAVARFIAGRPEAYDARPWFWSDQFDVKLQIAGLSSGYDHVLKRNGSGASASFWYYRGPSLLAVDAVNEPRAYMVARRLIDAGKSPSPSLVEDPATDLRSLLEIA
jgi:3-phenylpropionate/trans-cinnamate dioxygenase ferredoxin reductase subunit